MDEGSSVGFAARPASSSTGRLVSGAQPFEQFKKHHRRDELASAK